MGENTEVLEAWANGGERVRTRVRRTPSPPPCLPWLQTHRSRRWNLHYDPALNHDTGGGSLELTVSNARSCIASFTSSMPA